LANNEENKVRLGSTGACEGVVAVVTRYEDDNVAVAEQVSDLRDLSYPQLIG
jgi:hypothetical protein